MAQLIKTENQNSESNLLARDLGRQRYALSGWPTIICWVGMLVFACHACTRMVAAGDTWVAMACGRHFLNRAKAQKTLLPFRVDTIEPFSANSHKAGPTLEEIKGWPDWAKCMVDVDAKDIDFNEEKVHWLGRLLLPKFDLETIKYWHPTGWVNQNWLTHVMFYWLTHESPFADADTFSFNTLVYWKFAIYIIAVICVYYTGRLLGVNPALSAAFACFALFTGRSLIDIRPAGFSNVMVAVFLLILVLATYRNILYIWLLVPATVFWCNVHGGYIYVFIMLTAFFAIHFLIILPRRWTVPVCSIGIWMVLYLLAYKFLSHEQLESISIGKDRLFSLLLILTAASLILTAVKQVRSEVLYGYHVLASLIVFVWLLTRFFPEIPYGISRQDADSLKEHIAQSWRNFVIIFVGMTAVSVVVAFLKDKLIRLRPGQVCQIAAAGLVSFVAMVILNPFHLTNLTHTFVISVSEHAKMWRTIHEWRPAFEWTNPVGTAFPFFIIFIMSIGLPVFWLFSRVIFPKLHKAPKNELEAQKQRFNKALIVFGWLMAIFIGCVTLISCSLLGSDAVSLIIGIMFMVILLLSVYRSVHFIYLVIPLTLLGLLAADPNTGYAGRYIYPFILLPSYVILHIFVWLFSKAVKITPRSIIFALVTTVTSLILMVLIFNPLKFGFLFTIGSGFQRDLDSGMVSQELWRQFSINKLPLSQNAVISVKKPGRRWMITDKVNNYPVRKENQKLNIYKYESESAGWLIGQLTYPHRMQRKWYPMYERVGGERLDYKNLFAVIYIINIVSIIVWLAIPYLRGLFNQVPEVDKDFQDDTYQPPVIDLPLMAISALTVYMAIRSRRFIPIAGVAACPILAMLIDQMTRTISAARNFHKSNHLVVGRMKRKVQLFFALVGAVVVLAVGVYWGLKFKHIYLDFWPTDTKFNSVFMRMTASNAKPFYAGAFIKDNKLKGNMLNYWTEGGFIAWAQEPDPVTGKTPLQLFMDGRAQAAYDRRAFLLWSEITSGGQVAQQILAAARARGRTITAAEYRRIGDWIDKQLKAHNVWVVLMPTTTYNDPRKSSYHFVKGLEYHPDWPLVFFNDKQKLFVDITTPQGKELFDGVFDGKTLYPDEFSKNLILAHYQLRMADEAERKKGFDHAIRAFELNPSQAPMLEILTASRFPELRPFVEEFCRNKVDNFTQKERLYTKEHGIYHEIVAMLRASEYLKRIAQIQENTELEQFYNTNIQQYDKELKRLLYTKRW